MTSKMRSGTVTLRIPQGHPEQRRRVSEVELFAISKGAKMIPLPEVLLAVLCLALLGGVVYESYRTRKMRRFILSRRCEHCRKFYLVIESTADRCGAFCSARCEEAEITSIPLGG